MITKYLAIFIAALLGLSLLTASAAYAQNATSLQIQLVPKIQRGHQQQLTIFAVDNQGNQVNGSGEIISSIENAQGTLVGPKTVYTESGEHISYKVGPNTKPQNITVNSCLSSGEICAEQSYYVFPKGQGQTEPPIVIPEPGPVPSPEPPAEANVTAPEPAPADNQTDGEIIVPANETEVTVPENGTDVTVNDTGEAPALPPLVNQTQPQNQTGQPTIPIPPQPQPNATIPIEGNITLPENETQTQNENETAGPGPIDTEICPPVCGNETIPATNATLPVEGNITLPSGNETETGGSNANETAPENCLVPPCPPSGPQGNETTLPVEGNITLPVTNATQNATVEPEPIGNGNETNGGNGGGIIIEVPGEPHPSRPGEPTGPGAPAVNASEAFENLENTTTIQDEKIDEVRDNGNDTNRAELKQFVADTSEAIGDVSHLVVNATNDQLSMLQNGATSMSEAIDEIVNPSEPEPEAEPEADNGGEDDQGENEQ